MNKVFLKKYWQVLTFNFLILFIFIAGYGHFGDIIVDSFREAYIPQQILNGQVLYKNIFNVYAPLAYLFNAFLFKIFGVKLGVLYFAGLFATLGISNLTYLLSNKFLDKSCSFAIVLFFIASSVLSPNVFNCIFPYSYGMLYGLLFILGAIYCTFNKQYSLSYLLYSFSVCSKYEFILLLPLLITMSWKDRNIRHAGCLVFPFILVYAPLFIQGADIRDFVISYQLVLTMSATKTLYWFYSVMGLVFRPELIPIYLENLFKIAIPVTALFFIDSYFLIPLLLVYCYFVLTAEILIYIFPLILILYIIRFKKLSCQEKFFIPACILVSMKIFFAMTLLSYGVYFVPFALIPAFILAPNKLRKSLVITLFICAASLMVKNSVSLINKNVKIHSSAGTVYSFEYPGKSVKELTQYIEKNTKPDEKVLVYPEGLAVNVMSGRKSDNKFYSLIPLYVETFSEELVIKRLEITRPEYIIISNYDTSNYYYSYFGIDYAGSIFDFIVKNYDKQSQIGRQLGFVIFKIKSRHPSQKHA